MPLNQQEKHLASQSIKILSRKVKKKNIMESWILEKLCLKKISRAVSGIEHLRRGDKRVIKYINVTLKGNTNQTRNANTRLLQYSLFKL